MGREYTDLDYWEDQQTVREMERSIESSEALLRRLNQSIASDRYLLTHAQERLAAHPEYAEATDGE